MLNRVLLLRMIKQLHFGSGWLHLGTVYLGAERARARPIAKSLARAIISAIVSADFAGRASRDLGTRIFKPLASTCHSSCEGKFEADNE